MKNRLIKLFVSISILFSGSVYADVIMDDWERGIDKKESINNYVIIGIVVIAICVIGILSLKLLNKKDNNNKEIANAK